MRDPVVELAERVAEQGRDLARQAGRVDAVTEQLRADQVETAQRAGLPADLVSVEQSVWKRLTPGRNPWPQVAEFDERVSDLEQRQAEVHRRIAELGEQLQNAPGRDAQVLAWWPPSSASGDGARCGDRA